MNVFFSDSLVKSEIKLHSYVDRRRTRTFKLQNKIWNSTFNRKSLWNEYLKYAQPHIAIADPFLSHETFFKPIYIENNRDNRSMIIEGT